MHLCKNAIGYLENQALGQKDKEKFSFLLLRRTLRECCELVLMVPNLKKVGSGEWEIPLSFMAMLLFVPEGLEQLTSGLLMISSELLENG
jgi:hypothetical protein